MSLLDSGRASRFSISKNVLKCIVIEELSFSTIVAGEKAPDFKSARRRIHLRAQRR
jgi:hypothetical protein